MLQSRSPVCCIRGGGKAWGGNDVADGLLPSRSVLTLLVRCNAPRLRGALAGCGVNISLVREVEGPCGTAVILLEDDGEKRRRHKGGTENGTSSLEDRPWVGLQAVQRPLDVKHGARLRCKHGRHAHWPEPHDTAVLAAAPCRMLPGPTAPPHCALPATCQGRPTFVSSLLAAGDNRIIIHGGANTAPWQLSADAQVAITSAGALLLQREIPEAVNIEVAQVRVWAVKG